MIPPKRGMGMIGRSQCRGIGFQPMIGRSQC
jgi:hypothetical protein